MNNLGKKKLAKLLVENMEGLKNIVEGFNPDKDDPNYIELIDNMNKLEDKCKEYLNKNK